MPVNRVVINTENGAEVLIDLTGDTVKADKLAKGVTAHDAAGNVVTGVLDVVSPKVHLDQGVMYAPAASAYYRPQTTSDFSINFNYFGGSGCEQIIYPITGLVPGVTYTLAFSETYNGSFIGDAYWYGCGVMQESEYNATTWPVNAGKPAFITWQTATPGTQSSAITFTANTTKAYWVWSMARCQDNTVHNITFNVKAQAAGISLQDKTVTANGTVMADSGYDGLGTVRVNVAATPKLQTKAITVTENGTLTIAADAGYDGLSSAQVTVNVAGSGADSSVEDGLISGELSGEYTNAQVRSIGDYGFAKKNVAYVNFLAATYAGQYAFMGCSNLTGANFPKLGWIAAYAFVDCTSLKRVKFPAAYGVDMFAFLRCTSLEFADFSGAVTIGNNAFNSCEKLIALILRNNTRIPLSFTASPFSNTPIGTGTGYIYVPRALVAEYQTANYWYHFADQFRALEDYTVDGTTTGELDESKI